MTHLIILGKKVNTWAWGLEEALRLSDLGVNVTILDFGTDKISKTNPRSLFQTRVLDSSGIKSIPWNSYLAKEDLKNLATETREVIRLIAKSKNWNVFEYRDLPVGRILMSSYARTEGARSFPLHHVPVTMQYSIINQVLMAYYAFSNLNFNIEKVILSNGRGPIDATILAMSRHRNIQTLALESGGTNSRYFVYKNSPHFSPDWWQAIKDKTKLMDETQINAASNAYWKNKLKGIDEISNRDWSKEFDSNSLPANLPNKFIVYFCTSEHEVPAFDDFEDPRPEFKNQQEAVNALAKICSEMGLPLVVKRHPNSVSKKGIDNEKSLWSWAENSKGILYLGPDSRVDSYALMRRSYAVLTYKSSTGIEAAALKVPSRSLGPAKWAYTANSRADSTQKIIQFLNNPTCLDSSHSKIWGAFMQTFGRELKIFSQIKGGFALAEGVKYFASDYYLNPWKKFFQKAKRRLVDSQSVIRLPRRQHENI